MGIASRGPGGAMITVDVAIIGAGMAGASLAAEVAPHASVILVEGESRPDYHATGRSAAFWSETYGGPAVQPLTSASGRWLASPPSAFAASGFLRRRGAIHLANAAGKGALEALSRDFAGGEPLLAPLDRHALEARIPGLKNGWDAGLLEASTADIDVAALHAAYLRSAKRGGAAILLDAPLRRAATQDGRWRIAAGNETVSARILVNAAGAWADDVARRAGIRALGIRPYRRTMVQLEVDPPPGDDLPLVIDAAGGFYFKSERGSRLWLSPHDEGEAMAGDVAPDELDVAIALDRLGKVVDWRILRVERRWAGLRSFAPDRLPVYGFDPNAPSFFWFAGQGGFGIQTAPAAAKLGASLLFGIEPDPLVAEIETERYRPDRFTN